jgi:divalent metal cation (Fe/Co/Zn/Cd) transporter
MLRSDAVTDRTTIAGSEDRAPGTAAARRWLRIAFVLALVGMTWMVVEGVVAVWSGIAANSVALVAFGLDSAIELAAAALVTWRVQVELRGADRERVEHVDHAVRRGIGVTFFALALYVVVDAGHALFTGESSETSAIGLALCLASVLLMPTLAWGKLRAARELGSRALRAEAKESIACAYLAFTTLLGLAFNAWRGWSWADPLAALLMVPWLVHEGIEGVRGGEHDDD